MIVLVSDTSVLIDLERAELTRLAFDLPYAFAVPDVLYAAELADFDGAELCALGLRVEALEGGETLEALAIRRARPGLSVPDAFALSLAQSRGWGLLSGDGLLRREAAARGVNCRGILWLLDELEAHATCSLGQLGDSLEKLAAHPRCRLPIRDIKHRLDRYRRE